VLGPDTILTSANGVLTLAGQTFAPEGKSSVAVADTTLSVNGARSNDIRRDNFARFI